MSLKKKRMGQGSDTGQMSEHRPLRVENLVNFSSDKMFMLNIPEGNFFYQWFIFGLMVMMQQDVCLQSHRHLSLGAILLMVFVPRADI